MTEMTLFKPLTFFFVAANSLIATGLLTKSHVDVVEWLFLFWIGLTGIFLTYRFNDFIDHDANLEFHWREFLLNRTHMLVILQFIIFLVPLSFIFFSPFRVSVLAIAGFLGFLYSLKIKLGDYSLRLKHIFLVKNLLIGLCWGALVLVGADTLMTDSSIALFYFTSLQVFVGSSIRDISDAHQDQIEYVHSLPVVLGLKNTITLLSILNIASFMILVYFFGSSLALMPGVLACSWRALTLYKISKQQNPKFWIERMNLLTCFIIFLGQLITWSFISET